MLLNKRNDSAKKTTQARKNSGESKDPSTNWQEMRLNAERVVPFISPENIAKMSQHEIQQTLHELHVHQVELEMQNDELRRIQLELDNTRQRYFDLYNQAPVGYVTLNENGLIFEANLTIAEMLIIPGGDLVRQPLSRFIVRDDQDIYYLLRTQLVESGEPQQCELRMVKKDGTPFWAHLSATEAQCGGVQPLFRAVISDITERKNAEAKVIDQLHELIRWEKITLGRENRIIELKLEVNKLLAETGKPPIYTNV